mmetsp:Transcript_12531/g.22607  ORF Transcript_12531/g.22607 Transcript_12531/m.22607 type:complete len:112 (-) Transcript_12531:1275-1610(-)
MVSGGNRSGLQLYKKLLRSHRIWLRDDMRALGDRYVRTEFSRHKNVDEERQIQFCREWTQYLHDLPSLHSSPSQPLSPEQIASMTPEQRIQLAKLHQAATGEKDPTLNRNQ